MHHPRRMLQLLPKCGRTRRPLHGSVGFVQGLRKPPALRIVCFCTRTTSRESSRDCRPHSAPARRKKRFWKGKTMCSLPIQVPVPVVCPLCSMSRKLRLARAMFGPPDGITQLWYYVQLTLSSPPQAEKFKLASSKQS